MAVAEARHGLGRGLADAEVRDDALGLGDVLAAGPGIAIFLAVFSFNFLGDALRDALDPRLRRAQ